MTKRYSTEGMQGVQLMWSNGKAVDLSQFNCNDDDTGMKLVMRTECKPVTINLRFKRTPPRFLIGQSGRTYKWYAWELIKQDK